MKLEKVQNIMGWVMASLIPLGILLIFFPSLSKLFLILFVATIIFIIWEKEQKSKSNLDKN